MEGTAVTVRVPATSANIGTGFDCLGLALDLFASVTVTFSDAEQIPTNDVGEKMVLSAARAAYERIGRPSPAGSRTRREAGPDRARAGPARFRQKRTLNVKAVVRPPRSIRSSRKPWSMPTTPCASW